MYWFWGGINNIVKILIYIREVLKKQKHPMFPDINKVVKMPLFSKVIYKFNVILINISNGP